MPSAATSERPAIEVQLGASLAAFPEIAAAWLFGSRARGDAREDSDVDVAILLGEGVDAHDPQLLGAVAAALEHASGGLGVDLVVLDLARQGPVFCHRVVGEGRLVHDADRSRRVDFRVLVERRGNLTELAELLLAALDDGGPAEP